VSAIYRVSRHGIPYSEVNAHFFKIPRGGAIKEKGVTQSSARDEEGPVENPRRGKLPRGIAGRKEDRKRVKRKVGDAGLQNVYRERLRAGKG